MQATQHFPHASNPLNVHAVIETVKELTELMSREVELLRAMRVQEMGELQERKLTLVNSYETEIRALRSQPEFLDYLDDRLKTELKEVLQQLNVMVSENERALLSAKTANERLMQAVSKAVKKKTAKTSGYSNAGTINKAPSRSGSVHVNHCL
ncbi:hypothetical protein [Kiloniella sp. b19]|uniref:hypothetical protein n=1 Tax=Kiloniella sp. GXU_MW_B19 TaxID=3141326 RepID=UPI0031D84B90